MGAVLPHEEEGAEVKVVGAGGARSYTSKHGYPVTVDVQADAVTAVEFDAVIVPGGYAPDMMRRHDPMVKLVRDAAQQGKVVAAICHAGWMLASAGVVKGKKVTSFFSIKDDMVNAGGQWIGQRGGRGRQPRSPRGSPTTFPPSAAKIVRALAKTTPSPVGRPWLSLPRWSGPGGEGAGVSSGWRCRSP